jgi:hypothetical protein
MREMDGPSLIFIDFYVPVFTLRFHWSETMLLLSENVTFLAICDIYTRVISKDGYVDPWGFDSIFYTQLVQDRVQDDTL